jgi:uncharacterized RDD family membrane protein YckC
MVCSKCGTRNPEGANFSIGYGTRFMNRNENISSTSYIRFAGFWERFLAYCIDSIIVTLASIFVLLVIAFFIGFVLGLRGMDVEEMEGLFVGLYYMLSFISGWLYFTIMESSKLQATIGKKILNLAVTDVSGVRISFARSNARFWSKLISGIILCIGYIMVAFTEKHQALHDMVAGTLVVKKK